MSARLPQLALALLAVATLAYGTATLLPKTAERGIFWDTDYYRAAGERYRGHDDPYLADGAPTGYFYSASILGVLSFVFGGDGVAAPIYGLIAALGIVAALALALAAHYRPAIPLALCCLYLAALGNGQALYLFASGNLTWLAGLLLGGALLAASRERWPAFYLLVGLAALIKPQSLALLLVPIALRAISPWLVVALLPTALDALATAWMWPGLASHRAAAVWLGVGEPTMLRYSLAGFLSRLLVWLGLLESTPAITVGLAIQVVFAVALVALIRLRGPQEHRAALAVATVGALCAMPRLSSYDAFLFGPAIFAAFWPAAMVRSSIVRRGLLAMLLAAGLFKEGLTWLPVFFLAWLVAEAVPAARARTEERPSLAPAR